MVNFFGSRPPQQALYGPSVPSALRTQMALDTLRQGTSGQPVGSIGEGIARMGTAALGGHMLRRAGEDAAAERQAQSERNMQVAAALMGLPGARDTVGSVLANAPPAGGFASQPSQDAPQATPQPVPQGTPAPVTPVREIPLEIDQIIQAAADEFGVDAEFMRTLAGPESGYNPTAVNRLSDAEGLYQFLPSIWRNMVERYGAEMGIAEADIADPNANARMAARAIRDEYYPILGDDASPTDLHMAHFFGPGTANRLRGVDPSQSIEQALASAGVSQGQIAATMEQNPNLRGLTLGQVVAMLDEARGGTPPMDVGPLPGTQIADASGGGTPDTVASVLAAPSADPVAQAMLEPIGPRETVAGALATPQQQAIMTAIASGDPMLSQMGMQAAMQMATATGQPPNTRTIDQGDQTLTQEFRNGQWVTIAQGPRWNPNPPPAAEVNINEASRDAAREESVAIDADRVRSYIEVSDSMRQLLPELDRLDAALGAYQQTGALGETRLLVNQVASALGLEVEGLAEGEVIQSIVSRLAPRMREVGSGATSDFEVRMFIQALPNLTRTVEGNRRVIEYLRRLVERRQEEADLAYEAFQDGRLGREFTEELRALSPLFTEEERQYLSGQSTQLIDRISQMGESELRALNPSEMTDEENEAASRRLQELRR